MQDHDTPSRNPAQPPTMSDEDFAYWNDDPSDPMPTLNVPLPVFTEKFRNAFPNCEEMFTEALLDNLAGWWKQRIERERLREHPHPDTEKIAYNIEH